MFRAGRSGAALRVGGKTCLWKAYERVVHKLPPNGSRDKNPIGSFRHRSIVVVAGPDGDGNERCIPDSPRVTKILRGTGFSRDYGTGRESQRTIRSEDRRPRFVVRQDRIYFSGDVGIEDTDTLLIKTGFPRFIFLICYFEKWMDVVTDTFLSENAESTRHIQRSDFGAAEDQSESIAFVIIERGNSQTSGKSYGVLNTGEGERLYGWYVE